MSLRSPTVVFRVEGRRRTIKQLMYIVYILASKQYTDRIYVGLTEDISQRVGEHNSGKSPYSKKYGPWELRTYITFDKRKNASDFEKYLKSGSGFAFLKKHLL